MINLLIEQYVPIKKLSKKVYQWESWINRDILKSLSQRDKSYKGFIKENYAPEKADLFRDFKLKRNEIVALIRESKSSRKTPTRRICGKESMN